MTSNIHFGGIKNRQGKATINDVASTGLDIENLIKAELYSKEEKIKKTQDIVDLNTKKLGSLAELRSILININNAASDLYLKDNSGLHSCVFDKRIVSVSNSDNSTSNTYIEAKSDASVPEGEYEISVGRLTSFQKQISNNFPSSTADVTGILPNSFGVGSFEINGQAVNIEAGDCLSRISNKINDLKETSHVKSYCMKITPTNYVLVLQATKAGTDNSFTITDPNNILLNIQFTDSPAQDAELIFDNIPMSRSDNVVEDIINGMTINMRRPTPLNVTSTIEVSVDYDAILSQIYLFSEEYNKFIDFYQTHNAKKDGKKTEYDENAILHNEKILSDIKQQFRSFFTFTFQNNNSDFPNLTSIGINPIVSSKGKMVENKQTYNFSEKMQVEIDKLRKALLDDFEAVRNLLGVNYSASSPQFNLSKISNHITKQNFQLNVDYSQLDAPSAFFSYLDKYNNLVQKKALIEKNKNNNNLTIVGPKDSEVRDLGILYLYNGQTSAQSDISISIGMAAKFSCFLNEVLSDRGNFGLRTAEENLLDQLTKKEDENVDNKKKLEDEEQKLVKKYSKIQGAIDKYDKQLSALKALDEERRAK